ncbi:MAG: hypothetical protein IPH36_19045 [Saprospiraceae bacterium]|nr:hypothetical protein [Saprospiraceae bacterium]
MATRLTGFSKLMITLAILAVIFFGVRYLLNNTKVGQDLKNQAATNEQESKIRALLLPPTAIPTHLRFN